MPVLVEILSSPGCAKCAQAKQVLRAAAEEWGARVRWREVNILEDLDYALRLGVFSTPAIAVDGELWFSGMPSPKKLRERLAKRLEEAS